MSDVDVLVVGACGAPKDDVRRLVLADYLEEHNDAELAAVLRDDARGPKAILDCWHAAVRLNRDPDYKLLWAVAVGGLAGEQTAPSIPPVAVPPWVPAPEPIEDAYPGRRRRRGEWARPGDMPIRPWEEPWVRWDVTCATPLTHDSRPLPEPSGELPGSKAKMAVIEARNSAGQQLWHPADRTH